MAKPKITKYLQHGDILYCPQIDKYYYVEGISKPYGGAILATETVKHAIEYKEFVNAIKSKELINITYNEREKMRLWKKMKSK